MGSLGGNLMEKVFSARIPFPMTGGGPMGRPAGLSEFGPTSMEGEEQSIKVRVVSDAPIYGKGGICKKGIFSLYPFKTKLRRYE